MATPSPVDPAVDPAVDLAVDLAAYLAAYLAGYPADVRARVLPLLGSADGRGRLSAMLQTRYADGHAVRSDAALYAHVQALKARHLRSAPPLAKVAFDNRLQLLHQALGTHTAVSRVQGGQLKAKREIRVAALFKEAPAAFLDMIVVHELAHLKQRAHNKAFYALCCHMLADYHQIEFDLRLWLSLRALASAAERAAP